MARDQRRLAAIVSADVVGYSLLMGRDDSATLAGLKAHRRELIDPKIAEYGGRIVKTTGDGLLLEFASVVEAVRCAVDVQLGMAERNAGTASDQRIDFRVGINVGDIIIDDDDIFGDGVNVAARLQALAEPGGIWVSRVVRDQVSDKLSLAFQNLGAQELKNIARLVEVYRIDLGAGTAHGQTVAVPARLTPLATHVAVDDGIPSIAVLPFVNLSGDVANEYFADGIAEELLNVLSKIHGLRVVSRTSSFYFKGKDVDIPTIAQKLNVATVLEGSVRKSGKRVRITAQLVHVASDAHLWSEIYDRELDDIFAVQYDIAQSVVEELRAALLGEKPNVSASAIAKAEVQAAVKGRGENAEAYRLYLQGRFFEDRVTREDTIKAIQYFLRALEIDSAYPLAWAGLSRAYSNQAGYFWDSTVEGFRKAREAAERALRLEPDLAEGHTALGLIRMLHDWDWRGADASFRQAMALAPGDTQTIRGTAMLAGSRGQLDEAIGLLRRAVTLDPLSAPAYRSLARGCHCAGLLDEAEAAAARAIDLNPRGGLTHCWLGMVYLDQGRLKEALEMFQREGHDTFRLQGLAVAEHARGHCAASEAALEELIDKDANRSAYQIAEAHAYRREANRAFEWLERAYVQREPNLSLAKVSPLLRNLHEDPRWQTFLERMGVAD